MARQLSHRFLSMLGVLLGLCVIVFVLQVVVPANPGRAMLGTSASPTMVAAENHSLGYGRSLPARFGLFMGRLLRGDLGTSIRTRDSVISDLGHFVPATLELALAAMFIAIVVGVALGIGLARGGPIATAGRHTLIFAASLPTFLVGLLGIVLFYSTLMLLPSSGQLSDTLSAPSGPTGMIVVDGLLNGRIAVSFDALQHLIMPAMVLALAPALAISRVLSATLRRGEGEDYVRTARSKGISEHRVLIRHQLRNALGPVLAMTGLQFGMLLTGVVIVEQIFAWPGIGLYLDQSIAYGDFAAITGVTLVIGVAYVLVNFMVDMAQIVADPRMRA